MNLSYAKLDPLPLSNLTPRGWIKEFLIRQIDGLTGHIEEAGYPYNTKMWASNTIEPLDSASWFAWWPFEQTAYYLDGAFRVGTLMHDKNLLSLVQRNIEFVLDNFDETNNRIATRLEQHLWRWPYAQFGRMLMQYYTETNDGRVLTMLARHYRSFQASDFADDLELANVEILLWVHSITKESKFLQMSIEAYDVFRSDVKYRNRQNPKNGPSDMVFESDRIPDHHAVVYLELLKIPVLLYLATGESAYLEEAKHGLVKMEDHFMLVDGLPSSTEHFASPDELSGHETCNTATLPYTYGWFARATQNPLFYDRIEYATFNASMGSIKKDFKAHQYFSAPNQYIASMTSNYFGHHASRMAYLPGHDVECCTGNVNRFMPYYVGQMYMKDRQDRLHVCLYGPSQIRTSLNHGETELRLTQQTNYPFEDRVHLKLEVSSPTIIALLLRIPTWAEKTSIHINNRLVQTIGQGSTFHELRIQLASVSNVVIQFHVEPKITMWKPHLFAVKYGPLLFARALDHDAIRVHNYGKSSDDFPAEQLFPRQQPSYQIDQSASEDIQICRTMSVQYPWDMMSSPLILKVPAFRTGELTLRSYDSPETQTLVKTTPRLKPASSKPIPELLTLVPFGTTLLRQSLFLATVENPHESANDQPKIKR